MIVDLNPLPFKLAFDIIDWCWRHDIDKEKCLELIEARSVIGSEDVEWSLDIPEKYITMFVLKWNFPSN